MKLIALLMLSTITHASANFAPENDRKIPVYKDNQIAKIGIDQTSFNNVITKVLTVYKPLAAGSGGKLTIKKLWADPTVNSNTDEIGNNWVVNAFGGLARYPTMTQDAYMLVLCHEIYHHMGGYPKSGLNTWKNNITTHWASNEGESDYGAALKCFKRMVQNDNNQFFGTCNPGTADQCCNKTAQDAGICTRTLDAGIILAGVLHDLAGADEPFKVSLDTPDQTRVKKTYDGHPNSQARLDTYVAGAICAASVDVPFSNTSPIPGSCSEENGDIEGFRPRSWYKPMGIK